MAEKFQQEFDDLMSVSDLENESITNDNDVKTKEHTNKIIGELTEDGRKVKLEDVTDV